MTKVLTTFLVTVLFTVATFAQTIFDEEITVPAGYVPSEVVMPPSPLEMQVLFIGNVDMVQHNAVYGNPAGEAPAKQWHDFIGFTPDETGESLGWVSVNHERIESNDVLGDGGGMTTFRVQRLEDGSLEVMDQTLADGREGKFFNVDFVNTVGETGMNCGGITSSKDGRIWTAEEWFRRSNSSFPIRDTSDVTLTSDIDGPWNGTTVKRYQTVNWMVEIDPRESVAVRKQYNWGRQPFEGGSIPRGDQFVYLGPDATPAPFGLFIAQTPGDFTKGTLFAYKEDKPGWPWVPIWEEGYWLDPTSLAWEKGATMYNRIEWVAVNPVNNNIYWTSTGRDNPGGRYQGGVDQGGQFPAEIIARAEGQGTTPTSDDYVDYYGRIWCYEATTGATRILLEGGPFFEESPEEGAYPAKHLSNPDGLNVMMIQGKPYLVICEDLNGTSNGRVPAGVSNRTCELFILDLSIQNPSIDDLIRIGAVPAGAEVTGAQPTSDGKSLLVNSQHPSTDNPFPFNNSLTYAINGFDKLDMETLAENPFNVLDVASVEAIENAENFSVYPNPTTQMVYFNQNTDVALYDANGKRLTVVRNTTELNVSNLNAGFYFIQNANGETVKLNVQK